MLVSATTYSNAAVGAGDGPLPPEVAHALASFAALAPPALILGAAGLFVCARRARDRRRAPLAAEAARVLAACRSTAYTYGALVDADRGIYDVDCSAFVGLLLQNVAPTAFVRIPREPAAPYPRAFQFYDFLAAPQPAWSLIPHLADAARGDVICWRLPPSATGDTGHVLVAAGAPTFDAALQTWSVDVYDSSNIPHFNDSRARAGTYHSGIGTGALRFRLDAAGRAAQFQFGPGDTFHAHPILVARLDAQCGATHR